MPTVSKGSFDLFQEERHKIDVKDRKILYHLLLDARMSYTEIAKKVGLSKESVQYRVKQLLEKGVLLQLYAELDYEKMGFGMYQIFLLLDESQQEKQKQLVESLAKDANVLRVIEFSDNWDMQVTLLARTAREFNDISERLLDPYQSIILQKDCHVVIACAENHLFPEIEGLPMKLDKSILHKPEEPVVLDVHDLGILKALCADARASTYDIASSVKLSADAIGLRIKRLVKNGIIRSFSALVNFSTLGYQGFVFSFSSSCLSRKEENAFFYYLYKHPNVMSVKRLLGKWDMNTDLVVKEPREFHMLIKEIKHHFGSTMRNYETLVVSKEHVFNAFPDVLSQKSV